MTGGCGSSPCRSWSTRTATERISDSRAVTPLAPPTSSASRPVRMIVKSTSMSAALVSL